VTKSTRWRGFTSQHLTSATWRITPGTSLRSTEWRLKVELDLAPTLRGSAAVVTVYGQAGQVTVSSVPLNGQGDAVTSVSFGRQRVKYVEVTLANASTRFSFWTNQSSPYSCLGSPRDDGLRQAFRATAFRRT